MSDYRDNYPLSDFIAETYVDGLMAADTINRNYAMRRADDLTAERDAAIFERDEMRGSNITPDDADRPLGQSVEYWQDRCLDHATALDKTRIERDALRAELDAATAALRGPACRPAPSDARIPVLIHPKVVADLRELLFEDDMWGVGYSEFVARAVAVARIEANDV